MIDFVDILIKPYGKRGHYPVLVELDWGNLPPRVRQVIGFWKPLQYVCTVLANDDHVPENRFYLNMEELLTRAATERSEAGRILEGAQLQLL